MKFCPNCGTKVSGAFCSECGAKIEGDKVVVKEQPKKETKTPQAPYTNAYKPISAWGYVGYSLLFSLPIAGFILLIVFSFSDDNINLRNYARSYWCMLLIVLCLLVLLAGLAFFFGVAVYVPLAIN